MALRALVEPRARCMAKMGVGAACETAVPGLHAPHTPAQRKALEAESRCSCPFLTMVIPLLGEKGEDCDEALRSLTSAWA